MKKDGPAAPPPPTQILATDRVEAEQASQDQKVFIPGRGNFLIHENDSCWPEQPPEMEDPAKELVPKARVSSREN